jgi:hypothetical protein
VHVAVLRRIKSAGAVPLNALLERFRDRCWACIKFVRFIIALMISGGLDEDTALDTILAVLPEEMKEWIENSELARRLSGILKRIKKFDPREAIARKVCEELGLCSK